MNNLKPYNNPAIVLGVTKPKPLLREPKMVVCDFETHAVNNGIVDVYLWGARPSFGDKKVVKGTNIYSFINYLNSLPGSFKVFFHNGSKFDFHYLLRMFTVKDKYGDFIFKQKFNESKKKILSKVDVSPYKELEIQRTRVLHSDDVDEKKINTWILKENEYSILIDNNKKIIQLKLGKPDINYRKKGIVNHTITFHDSLSIFKGSIAQFGDILNFPKLADFKGFLKIKRTYTDLNDFRKNVKNAEEHITYLQRDVDILYKYLMKMSELLPFQYWKATIASTAYSQFLRMSFCDYDKNKKPVPKNLWKLYEKITGSKIIPELKNERGGDFWLFRIGGNKYGYKSTRIAKKIFDVLFPTKWMNFKDETANVYRELRFYFRGGLTIANPNYQGLVLENTDIIKIDINSAYPTALVKQRFPIGAPVFKGGDFKLYTVTFKRNVQNQKYLPFLSEKDINNKNVYLQKIKKGDVFFVSSPELGEIEKIYGKKSFKKETMYAFDTVNGAEIFDTYIDYYWKLKNESKDKLTIIFAKLMLNSLYGKFGENNMRESKIFNPNNLENPFETERIVYKVQKFWPIAIATTGYVRMQLVKAVDNQFKNFHYCDTDSLFLSNFDKFKIPITKKLGGWNIEDQNITKFIARTSKQYGYQTGGKDKFTFAGIRNKTHTEEIEMYEGYVKKYSELSFDIMSKGGHIKGQIRPRRDIVWGRALEDYVKEIYEPHHTNYAYNPLCWFYVNPKKQSPKMTAKLVKKKYLKNKTKQLNKIYKALKINT